MGRPASPSGPESPSGPDTRPPQVSSRPANRRRIHFLAGVVSGAASTLATHPLDVIKTRLQVREGSGAGSRFAEYSSLGRSIRSLVAREGARGLYAGLTPALTGNTVAMGLWFVSYENAKRRYLSRSPTTATSSSSSRSGQPGLGVFWQLLAGTEAGALAAVATNPLWVVKTRLQVQERSGAGAYKGLYDAGRRIVREEGVGGLYKGLGPSLALVSHGAVQLLVYDRLRDLVDAGAKGPEGGSVWLSAMASPWLGGASKVAASLTTYPLQVVRSRMQQRQTEATADLMMHEYRTAYGTAARMLRREGPRAFYKGLLPNMLRAIPASMVAFTAYEATLVLLADAPRPTSPAATNEE